VKNNPSPLIILCALAALSLLIGAGLTIHSIGDMDQMARTLEKKSHDAAELAELKTIAARYRSLLNLYAAYPAIPRRFDALVHSLLPGASVMPRSTETHPAVPGWIAKTIKVGFTDIGGSDLDRVMESAAAEKPPWTAVEGTFTASPAAGRLAKVELSMETVERQDPAN